MEEKSKRIFREKSISRLSAPNQLNDYIQIANFNMWVVLAAAIVLVLSLLAWGIFGQIVVSEAAGGIAANGQITCYVKDSAGIVPGMQARVGDQYGQVVQASRVPLSRQEVVAKEGEFAVYELALPEYSYAVTLEINGIEDGIVDAVIIREKVKPISFILGSGGDA